MNETRICPGCGKPLASTRKNKKYHDDACKQAAYRRRVDPLVGSNERKESQIDGLEASGKSQTRKIIIQKLSEAGLLPAEQNVDWQDAEQDPTSHYASRWRKTLSAKKRSGASEPPPKHGRYGPAPWNDTTIVGAGVLALKRFIREFGAGAAEDFKRHSRVKAYFQRQAGLVRAKRGDALNVREEMRLLRAARGVPKDLSDKIEVFHDTGVFPVERPEEKEVLATDERLAVDAERLSTIVLELGEIAQRLRERFPQNTEIEAAVELFLEQVLGATKP